MQVSQQLAAQAVQQVLSGRNLTSSLEVIFRQNAQITPQQRAVAQDLSYGALRFYGQLQAILAQLVQKPLSDDAVRCLLLVALYQLVHDRAASHTVVDQAVKAAGTGRKPWAKSVVNAVLRNFLRQREPLMDNLSQAKGAQHEEGLYSYPQWWIIKLKQQYPQQWLDMLLAGNQPPPMTLRVNLRRHTQADYLAKLQQHGLVAQPLGLHALMLDKPVPVERLPGFFDGDVSVQDYGAQFAAPLLDIQPGMRVLDACCAPGGKTGHLLELADVRLLALDNDAGRIARTRDNLQRLGLQAELAVGDAGSDTWWDGVPFQRILADVPCTASGIVRRHVDIKWLRREVDIASFTRQQAAILPGLWRLLAKGGKLLYVTCSVFHEENQRQIDTFLSKHADAVQLALADIASDHQQNGQLLPCAQHDGFFYALLQKQ